MNSDAAELWLFARYPAAAAVVVASAAADMADYSGKSGNFALAQIAAAGRKRIFKWFTHMSSMVNECGLLVWSVSAHLCKYINDWH